MVEEHPPGDDSVPEGKLKRILRHLLVTYHRRKTQQEVDLSFYARIIDYKDPKCSVSDLFSAFLCKEQVKWQTLLLLYAVYNVFAVPFAITFSRNVWPATQASILFLQIVELIGDGLFILEVLFNFFLPFEEDGVQVNIHSEIRGRYIKGWFCIDVLGALPIDLIAFILQGNSPLARLLRLNKLLRFFRLNFYWGRMEKNLMNLNPSLIRLWKFVFLFVLSAHWVACLWMQVVRAEGESSRKWVGLHEFGNEELWDMWNSYFQAFYWALVTMVGYGGTIPQRFPESAFSVFVVCVGVVLYVSVIGAVGSIMLDLDASGNEHRRKVENMNEFLKMKKVPKTLSNRVRSYYDFMWRSRQGIDSEATMNDLPNYLKIEVALHICKDMISTVPLFRGADEQFIREVVSRLRPLVCLPNTQIVTKGEMGKEMYFIARGKVAVIIEYEGRNGQTEEKVICELHAGQSFGEIALLCKSKRNATIRACEYCDLFILMADDFRALIMDNQGTFDLVRKRALEQYPTLREQLNRAFPEEDEGGGEGDPDSPYSEHDRSSQAGVTHPVWSSSEVDSEDQTSPRVTINPPTPNAQPVVADDAPPP
eukprot:Sspe_Gene.101988::Locus_76680_Transcript_1_1_Confidence_1.000_Length_2044::g.101988::m.101988